MSYIDMDDLEKACRNIRISGDIIFGEVDKRDVDKLKKILEEERNLNSTIYHKNDSIYIIIRPDIGYPYAYSKKELDNARKLYLDGNYTGAILAYEKLLYHKKLHPQIPARLGLSYMKLGNVSKAIYYLKMATVVSEVKNARYNFSDLVFQLEKRVNRKTRKSFANVNVEEFVKPPIERDARAEIKKIAEEMKNTSKNFRDVVQYSNYTKKQLYAISLGIAKICYAKNDVKNGDKYLHFALMHQKNKILACKVKSEVEGQKKFYSNKINDEMKVLNFKKF